MSRRVKRHEVTQPDDPSYRLIPLTRGLNAMVDAEDYEWLMQWNWHAKWMPNIRGYYAARNETDPASGEQRTLLMHAAILQPSPGSLTDHKNGQTLDNRRFNLREATCLTNTWNRTLATTNASGHRGVYWHPIRKKWQARIAIDGHNRSLGYFSDKEQASTVRRAAEIKLRGDFVRQE